MVVEQKIPFISSSLMNLLTGEAGKRGLDSFRQALKQVQEDLDSMIESLSRNYKIKSEIRLEVATSIPTDDYYLLFYREETESESKVRFAIEFAKQKEAKKKIRDLADSLNVAVVFPADTPADDSTFSLEC